MNLEKVLFEVNDFPSEKGIEVSKTPPKTWYQTAEFHALDHKLLKEHWQFVGHTGMLERAGSYFTGEFCDENFFVIKDDKNEIRAFHNVCSHHASTLLEGTGCVNEVVCPYHAWCYSQNGELKRAPQMAKVKEFDKVQMGLKSIPLKLLGPFILLNFSGHENQIPGDTQTEYEGILQALSKDPQFSRLKFMGRRAYEINCNWKVYIDNYLDGGYHVSHLHKGLAGQINMQKYKVEDFRSYTLQSCIGNEVNTTSIDGVDFQERIGSEALYYWIHPNFMLNRYGNIMDCNWAIPLGPEKCVTVFDYYFDLEKCDQKFIDASIKASEQVQKEDVQICETVQKGLRSSAYRAGRYAPQLETGAFLFHSLLQKEYLKILKEIKV
jgi:choline monooxygenase